LGQLSNLTNLELNNNDLTGSVPVSIVLNRTYVNFDVYGNQLSALSPIDGQTICTSINNTIGAEGEHYCNCASDCFAEPDQTDNDFGRRCQCEEAQSCCNTYFVDNNITRCVLCESGLSNPDLVVAEWNYMTCDFAVNYVYNYLKEHGTEEQCAAAKFEVFTKGCICPDYSPPGEATTKPAPLEDDDNIFVLL